MPHENLLLTLLGLSLRIENQETSNSEHDGVKIIVLVYFSIPGKVGNFSYIYHSLGGEIHE